MLCAVKKYISQEAMQNSVVPEINYVAMLTASICGMVRTVRRLETDGMVTPRPGYCEIVTTETHIGDPSHGMGWREAAYPQEK